MLDGGDIWVLKYVSRELTDAFMDEIEAMRELREVDGVQKVLWICLDDVELIFATEYAGLTLDEMLLNQQLDMIQLLETLGQLALILQ